jgi:LuxR family transcriptional activator of conjugal transfer of Ti plasmids
MNARTIGADGKMTMTFQSFIDRLAAAGDRDTLAEALVRFAGGLGLAKFAYVDFRRPDPHLPVYLTNYPTEWVYHYVSRHYDEIDPVLIRARQSVEPFVWHDGMPTADVDGSGKRRQLFGEAAEFGIHCGLAIPVRDGQGRVAMVSFVSDRKPAAARRDIESHCPILHLASVYFHVHARRKLESPASVVAPCLTPPEVACLQWIARGRSPWDVGEILALPSRTVLLHLKCARQKLQAATLSQAVAVALYHRMIEL